MTKRNKITFLIAEALLAVLAAYFSTVSFMEMCHLKSGGDRRKFRRQEMGQPA